MERTRSMWTWRIVAGMLAGLMVGIGMAVAGDPAAGEKVYKKYKCSACHMVNGMGSKKADDLSHVGANRDAEWLKTYMVDPKSKFPNSKHPKWKGNDKELDALVAYMGSLK